MTNLKSISTASTGQFLHSPGELRAECRSLPPPLADEVQIALRATTLCGSDIHYFQHFRNGSIQVREPLCLGHEAAGEVVEAGSNVNLKIGDRVAIECGVPCEQCEWCLSGRYNLCPKLRFRSSGSAWPHFQGTLQTRINHPARWTHKYVWKSSVLKRLAYNLQVAR
jgi:L-iditol 2-dehydrogenase